MVHVSWQLTLFDPAAHQLSPSKRWQSTCDATASMKRTQRHAVLDAEEAELARRESEARYRTLVDLIPQHVWSTERDGRQIFVNNRTLEYTGATADQLQGERWVDFVHPDDRATVVARWRHALATGEPYRVEYRLRSASGEYRWFLGEALPERDASGEIVRWLGTVTDIDEERRLALAQQFLAEASRTLASSLDYEKTLAGVARLAIPQLADWSIIDLVEPDGRIRRVEVAHRDPELSDLAHALTGYSRDPASEGGVPEVIRTGRSQLIPEVTPDWVRRATGSDDALRRLAAVLGTRSIIIAPLEARGRTLGALTLVNGDSGRRFDERDLELAESVAARAALAVDNARLYRDTERAREEADNLARGERALREAVSAVAARFTTEDVIWQIAASAVDATFADSAFVTRIDEARAWVDVVALAGEIAQPLERRVPFAGSYTKRVTEHHEPLHVERMTQFEGPLAEGPLAHECPDCSALVVPLGDSNPVGALFLLRRPERPLFSPEETQRASIFGDLTGLAFRRLQLLEESEERREAFERLTESRTRLMRGFSHDVKNPLGVADGHAQLLEDGVFGELTEQQRESVGRIRIAIRRSLKLINDLLELAQAESGQLKLVREVVNVVELTRDSLDDFRAQATVAGLALSFEGPEELQVETDPGRVRQVLGNLLSNAVKYTPAGRIDVRVETRVEERNARRGEWIVVHVADTGPGIPEENQERIFQEFTRLDPDAQSGAGVGLAISRRIARLLGGDITLRSEPGQGSTFTLWLPR